jgi:hypothetical protein
MTILDDASLPLRGVHIIGPGYLPYRQEKQM